MGRVNKILFAASGSHDQEYYYRMNVFLLVFNRGYACAMIVHTNAIQALPELLMDHFDTLSTHYDNKPIQYTAIFHGCKNGNFQMKKCHSFLIFAQNIDCGCTLEPHH